MAVREKEMRDGCDVYNPVQLSRFADGEMDDDTSQEIGNHLGHCSICRQMVEAHHHLSTISKAVLKAELSLGEGLRIESRVIEHVRRKQPRTDGWAAVFMSKKVLIPVAAIASFGLFFLFSMKPDMPLVGPSAIIESFSGDISSVIIMETPESHETVLWYSENENAQRT
jgi:predicted anti-sigma-YlaC factor YlaD